MARICFMCIMDTDLQRAQFIAAPFISLLAKKDGRSPKLLILWSWLSTHQSQPHHIITVIKINGYLHQTVSYNEQGSHSPSLPEAKGCFWKGFLTPISLSD